MPAPRRLDSGSRRGVGGGVGIRGGPAPASPSSASRDASRAGRTWWSSAALVAFGVVLRSIATANVIYFSSGGAGPREASESRAAVVSPERLVREKERERSENRLSSKRKSEKKVVLKGQNKKPARAGDLSELSEFIRDGPVIRRPYNYRAAAEGTPRDFEPNPEVVIVTKIHGKPVVQQLRQLLCLLNVAYNHRTLHDIIVFMSERTDESGRTVSTKDIEELKAVVHPANLRVLFDEISLKEQFKSMTDAQRRDLLIRCNRTSTDEINWHTRCFEEGSRGIPMPLAYSWMAEFRSKYLWRHPALAPYKYMMWYDSDAFAARVWEQDPVAFAIRNDLVVLFGNFPQGRSYAPELPDRILKAYGEAICFIKLGEKGELVPQQNDRNKTFCPGYNGLPLIHGFFHITSLDFYRTEEALRWNDILIGDSRFSRRFDDQVQVTVPAAMRAPERAWDMNANGVVLDVWHNKLFDGDRMYQGKGYYVKYWEFEGKGYFPEAWEKCGDYIKNAG